MSSVFDLDLITNAAIQTIRKTQNYIRDSIIADSVSAFEPLMIGRREKPLLTIDLVAERNTAHDLRKKLRPYQLLAIGEESLRDETLDLSAEKKLVVLMDMVDGTDLLERGLSNWCSAMVFYFPPQRRIIASFIGMPEDSVYYATENSRSCRHLFHGREKLVEISGPSNVKSINSAALAFYGQKAANFLSVANHRGFISALQGLNKNSSSTRIYNLAGNPMMMKLIDGHSKIDAVFDIKGQAPHDVVPGAYIAQKANAFFCDLEGKAVDLSNILIRPAQALAFAFGVI